MANEQDRKLTEGAGGNTAGTGGPNYSGPTGGAGAGAAGSDALDDKALADKEARNHGQAGGEQGGVGRGSRDDTGGLTEQRNADDLGQADLEVARATEGGVNASTPGPRGGKLSSEGTGSSEPRGEAGGGSPSGGDIGGMGGAGSRASNPDSRPPGGVSPLEGRDE